MCGSRTKTKVLNFAVLRGINGHCKLKFPVSFSPSHQLVSCLLLLNLLRKSLHEFSWNTFMLRMALCVRGEWKKEMFALKSKWLEKIHELNTKVSFQDSMIVVAGSGWLMVKQFQFNFTNSCVHFPMMERHKDYILWKPGDELSSLEGVINVIMRILKLQSWYDHSKRNFENNNISLDNGTKILSSISSILQLDIETFFATRLKIFKAMKWKRFKIIKKSI